MSNNVLYHLVQKDLWQQAKESGAPYFPPTYQQDGFIHLTKDPAFLISIGNHFYKNVSGEWILLCIDANKLTGQVKYEPAAAVGNTTAHALHKESPEVPLFPHLYGTIDYASVLAEKRVERDTSGTFTSIEGL